MLSGEPFRPTESTHARHIWNMPVPELNQGQNAQREVVLWDLAVQPGYRIVHQLHLGGGAVALILFDSRSETAPLAGIGYWARALQHAQASGELLPTFLIGARTDRGVVGVSDERDRAGHRRVRFPRPPADQREGGLGRSGAARGHPRRDRLDPDARSHLQRAVRRREELRSGPENGRNAPHPAGLAAGHVPCAPRDQCRQHRYPGRRPHGGPCRRHPATWPRPLRWRIKLQARHGPGQPTAPGPRRD